MKNFHIYTVSSIAIALGLLAYFFDFSVSPSKVIGIEPTISEPYKSLADSLDTIPNHLDLEELKSALTPEQKKQLLILNETQQKQALSAMGHQQGVKQMVTYGEIELKRLQELDKEIANKDLRAEEIIESLNAKVALKKAQSEQTAPQ